MLRGVFVTGTDTGIGKTTLAAALMHRYRAALPMRYWKPIQTGIEDGDDTAEVTRLGACSPLELRADGIRLPGAWSPHLSARRAGTTIDLDALISSTEANAGRERWVVEGAGGVMVPINDDDLMVDLMLALALPAVVAARSTLGTINHTLLTLELLRDRGVPVAGVVMIGPADAENRLAIERYGRTDVLGEMPHFPELNAHALGTWSRESLDPGGAILRLLQ